MLVSNNSSSNYRVVEIINNQITNTYGQGELSQPGQISRDTDTGNIYVTDRGNNRIGVYESNSNLLLIGLLEKTINLTTLLDPDI